MRSWRKPSPSRHNRQALGGVAHPPNIGWRAPLGTGRHCHDGARSQAPTSRPRRALSARDPVPPTPFPWNRHRDRLPPDQPGRSRMRRREFIAALGSAATVLPPSYPDLCAWQKMKGKGKARCPLSNERPTQQHGPPNGPLWKSTWLESICFELSAAEHGRDVPWRANRRHESMFGKDRIKRDWRMNHLQIGLGRKHQNL